ncbi:MAG: hypothetical protein IRZ00_08940 [Gemmatimonadetes bacterium]|nr:hypothetical protein [Gemmatimonadota bacterium]
MNRWIRYGVVATGGFAAAATLTVVVGSVAWRRATERTVARLAAAAQSRRARRPAATTFSPAQLEGLPPPVARYFAFALPEGQPRIRAARIRWSGEFQIRPGGGWRPFTADQRFTTVPPGFVWNAEIHMMPLVPVRVRDSYVAGQGAMLGRLGGVVRVVDEGGTPEMAAGALVRWLGEAAWFPTALLPGEGVRWEAVDDSTARATITDGLTSASAEFHFAPGGEITRMTALRYRDVNGTGVLTPFEGIYRDYARREGVMVPLSAEVAWLLPEGRFPYWRARPTELAYELDPARPGTGSPDESDTAAGKSRQPLPVRE